MRTLCKFRLAFHSRYSFHLRETCVVHQDNTVGDGELLESALSAKQKASPLGGALCLIRRPRERELSASFDLVSLCTKRDQKVPKNTFLSSQKVVKPHNDI